MAQYTSEEALNGILNILETTVNQMNTAPRDSGDVISQLMLGLTAGASSGVSVGQQVEELANGMSILKQQGITEVDGQNVATIIREIGTAINDIKLEEVDNSSIYGIATALTVLGSIDAVLIDNINNLSKLDVSIADNIFNFISKLDFSNLAILQNDKTETAIKNLSLLMNSIVHIMNTSTLSAFSLLAPARGYLIGRSIGLFFEQIVRAIPERNIKIELKGVADLMNALEPLIASNSIFSIHNMKRSLSKENGAYIGAFFSSLIKDIPDKKEISEALKGVSQLFAVMLSEDALKNVRKAAKAYNEKSAVSISTFIKEIITASATTKAKSEAVNQTLPAVAKFIKEISSIGLIQSATAAVMFSILNEKNGQSIGGFIKNLCSSLSSKNISALKDFTAAMTDLSKGLLIVTGSIALMTGTIALFGITKVAQALGTTMLALYGFVQISKLISDNQKVIQEAGKSIAMLSLAVGTLILNVAAMAMLTKYADELQWESIGKVVLMISTIGIITYAMSKIADNWQKNGKDMMLAMIGISSLLLGGALTIKMLVDVAEEYSIGEVLTGLGMILGVVAIAWGAFALLAKYNKPMQDAMVSMFALTGLLLMTGLIIKNVLIPIGEESGPAALGVLVTGMTILGLGLIVRLLDKVAKPKDVLLATVSVAALAFLMMGVALITKEILIPLGERAEDAFIGAATAVTITMAFGAITWIASKMFKNDAELALAAKAMLAVGGIMVVMSLATKSFLSVAEQLKGLTVAEVAAAGLLTATLVSSFGLITYGLSKLIEKNGSFATNMALGIGLLTGVGLAIGVLSNMMGEYIELALELKEVNAEDLIFAGLTMTAVIGVFGALMFGLGTLMTGPGAVALALGAAGMAGIALVIDLTTAIVTDYVKRAVELSKFDYNDITNGSNIVLETITNFGAVMALAGLLSPMLAIGGLVMLELNGVMKNTISAMKLYAEGTLAMVALNNSKKWEGGDLQAGSLITKSMFESFYDLMDSLGIGVIKQAAYLAVYKLAMNATIDVMKKYADILIYQKKNITMDDLNEFNKIMIGSGLNDEKSMLGSLNTMVNGFIELGDVIDTGLFFIMGTQTAKTILDVMSKFIDVVAKAATLTYVMGYDDNGKPIYNKISPDDFGLAADNVTGQFKLFINRMLSGFEDVSLFSIVLCTYMDNAMNPVVDTMSKFVDVIMKVATMKYMTGYDSNGKPEYIQLSAQDFTNAATAVTDSFTLFVNQLSDNFKGMKLRTMATVRILGGSMGPIIESISDFIDAIMKAATGTYVIGYDEKGKAIYQRVDDAMLSAAATSIVNNFIKFIDSLNTEVTGMKKKTAKTIGILGEGLGPIMTGVSGFVDGILKAATGTYVLSYDENGKPNQVIRVSEAEMSKAADIIVQQFSKFMDSLIQSTKNLKMRKAEVIGEFGDSIGEVMDTVSSFVDAIMKFAGSTYITGYDANGKPMYEKIKVSDIDLAANVMINHYMQFIDRLITYASNPELKNKSLDYLEKIGSSISPIMESVIDFADMLTKFLKPDGTIKMPDGKEVPFRLDMDVIKDASNKIGEAYITFLDILITKLDKNENFTENAKKAAEYMTHAAKVIKNASDGAKAMSDMLKILKETPELLDVSNNKSGNLVEQFVNTLIYLGNRIIKSDVNFGLANQEMIYAQQFLTTSKEVSALLKELLNNLSETKNLANYNKYLTNFSSAISKLSETASMDVSQTNSLIPFMMQMNNAAKQLKILEETINSGDITKAVNKFINDINVLTKEQMDTKMKSSEMSLQSFASQLKVFNHEVSVTNTDVNSFSVSMDRASQAFQKFDKVLIEQEEKRNKALKQFGELIHNIADSVEKLSDKIESLDKNKILENFKGIVDLLKVAESTTGTGTTKTTGNAPATRVVSEQVVTQPAKIFENTIIEFRFDNTHFTGIANQI